VRHGGELAQDIDRLGPLEIEHEAALVAVERDEAHALAVADRRRGAAHVALRRLDLDHIGAHVGKERAGERPGDEIRELDHPYPRQRVRHVSSLVLTPARIRCSDHCIFNPPFSMISLYIGTSRAMRARKTSGPSATTGSPAFTNFSCRSGRARIAASSLASRSTIGCGVPAGT